MKLYWYVDKQYLGMTQTFHEMPLQTATGEHIITVVDENGSEIKRKVEVVRE
jgi:penicillin-binding protein 1C